MTRSNSELDRLRSGRTELENHYIDELVGGNLSRREFLRKGSTIGMSVPLLGAILAACGEPRRPRRARAARARPRGGPGDQGRDAASRHQPPGRGGQPAHRVRRRRAVHARPDGRVPDLRLQPEAGARSRCWPRAGRPTPTAAVWTFKLRPGVKFTTAADDRRRRRLHVPAAGRPQERSNALSTFTGVLEPAGVKKVDADDGRVPPRGAERQLPLPGLLGQLQRDHRPQGHRLRPSGRRRSSAPGRSSWPSYTQNVGATFVPNPDYWGDEGLLSQTSFTVLHQPAAADPGAPGRQTST